MRRAMWNTEFLGLVSRYQIISVLVTSGVALLVAMDVAEAALVAGLLMTANVKAMQIALAGIQKGARAGAAYALLMVFKLVIMLGVVAALLVVFHMSIAGVALGLSTLLLGVAVATVHQTANYPEGATSPEES